MIKYQLNDDEKLQFEGGLKENPKTQYHFFIYFFLRRSLYLLLIIWYNENLQLPLLILLNCLSFIYIGHQKPYASRADNRREIFYDWMVHFVSFHMIFFTAMIDYNMQEKIGLSMNISIIAMMAFSIFDVGSSLLKDAYLVGKKIYIRCKGRKKG